MCRSKQSWWRSEDDLAKAEAKSLISSKGKADVSFEASTSESFHSVPFASVVAAGRGRLSVGSMSRLLSQGLSFGITNDEPMGIPIA